jgi:hypothetical protein
MGTRKNRNSEIDEDAVHVVEGILRGADWNRSKPQPDKVGLDMRVDLLEDRHPQIGFYLQIKGMGPKTTKGKRQPLVSQTGTINKSIELEHLDYYMKLPVPVFLVVVDVVERVAYYVHIQRHVLEELSGDDWQERLRAHNKTHGRGRSKTAPTKTVQVPIKNILSDTAAFRDVVRDAKGYMESLSVEPGIKYQEAALTRLDERFKVTYIRDREGRQGKHTKFATHLVTGICNPMSMWTLIVTPFVAMSCNLGAVSLGGLAFPNRPQGTRRDKVAR